MSQASGSEKKVRASVKRELRDALRARVLRVSPVLPANYRERIVALDPALDTPKTLVRISAVRTVQVFDEHITALMERVAMEFAVEVQQFQAQATAGQ